MLYTQYDLQSILGCIGNPSGAITRRRVGLSALLADETFSPLLFIAVPFFLSFFLFTMNYLSSPVHEKSAASCSIDALSEIP